MARDPCAHCTSHQSLMKLTVRNDTLWTKCELGIKDKWLELNGKLDRSYTLHQIYSRAEQFRH